MVLTIKLKCVIFLNGLELKFSCDLRGKKRAMEDIRPGASTPSGSEPPHPTKRGTQAHVIILGLTHVLAASQARRNETMSCLR